MEQKKISFSFNKLVKKNNIISNNLKVPQKNVELIDCVEGQSIKIKNEVKEVKKVFVIPMQVGQTNLFDRIRDTKKRETQSGDKTQPEDHRPDSELSADEAAARLLMKEARDRVDGKNSNGTTVSVLSIAKDEPSLEGEKEPTLEDYESVPISEYGFALLRGMGWKEGMTIGKNTSKNVSVNVAPELRPKGLGLGATKVVQQDASAKKAVDKDGKNLILMNGSYAKIIAGNHKGNYCQVQGFNEEAGRVIVKIYPKGENINLNEIMLTPVTKEEFTKGIKILNNAKYEEYLELSNKKLNDNLEVNALKTEYLKIKDVKKEYHLSADMDTTEEKYCLKNTTQLESSSSEPEDKRKSRKHTDSYHQDRRKSKHKSKREDKHKRHTSRNEKREKSKRDKSKYKKSYTSSESDSTRDKRKRNKCKSRHRKNSSSRSSDEKYK